MHGRLSQAHSESWLYDQVPHAACHDSMVTEGDSGHAKDAGIDSYITRLQAGERDNVQQIMSDLRVVRFQDAQTFLEAVKPYDDSFMNFALGSVLDSLSPARASLSHTKSYRTLLAVYKGDKLL